MSDLVAPFGWMPLSDATYAIHMTACKSTIHAASNQSLLTTPLTRLRTHVLGHQLRRLHSATRYHHLLLMSDSAEIRGEK
jgi:hypothetical protein